MSENKINLVVPKDYNGKPIEVVLREGEAPVALDPKEPERVVINGTIDAPIRWLEKRVELINQKATNIIVNRDKMRMALTIDETSYYQTEINGILQASKEMQEFGINMDKKWEPIKLSQFFKMHRAFFKDKSESMTLVSTLKNFKAKVNQDIERSKEENGSKVDNYSQVVDSNLPKSFKLNIPLFKGFSCEEIEVEIYADVDGRDVSLSLVSAGANEAIEEYKKAAPEFGLEIVESGISTSADIPLAAEQLAAKVDCISNLTDNNVVSSLPVVLEAASKNGIPVFGSEIEQVKRGCLAAMGLDYIALGEQTGRMAAQVLKGEKEASEMPYELIEGAAFYGNTEAAENLGIELPESLTSSAAELFEEISE